MRIFVYACESMYGGLHGIEDAAILEAPTIESVIEDAKELAYSVIETYGYDWEDDDPDDHEPEYYVYPLDEFVCGKYSNMELENIAYEGGYDEFIRKYCLDID